MPFFYLVILPRMDFLFSFVLKPFLRILSALPMFCLNLIADLIRLLLEHVIKLISIN